MTVATYGRKSFENQHSFEFPSSLITSSSFSSASHSDLEEVNNPIDPEKMQEMRDQAKKVAAYGIKGSCALVAAGGTVASLVTGIDQIALGTKAGAAIGETVCITVTNCVIDQGHCDQNIIKAHDCKEKHCKGRHCVIL